MTTAWLTLLDARALMSDASDAQLASLALQLGPAEQARLPGFVRARRRREFILGRLLLRHSAARVASCPLQNIEVIERADAGPEVVVDAGLDEAIQASLSHGGGWIGCAVGRGFALGLDIETADAGRDLQALAQTALSTAERRWLDAQTDLDKAFYQLWCGKEALYKYRNNAGLPAAPGLPPLQCDRVNAAPWATDAALNSVYRSDAALHLTLCCPPSINVVTEEIAVDALLKRFI